MKLSTFLALSATASTAVLGAAVPANNEGKYLVELAPGKTQWVSQDEKWELRQDGKHFIDITHETKDGFKASTKQGAVKYPTKVQHAKTVKAMLAELSKENMERDLKKFSEFHNRYYKADTGVESATWLMEQAQAAIKDAGVEGAKVEKFEHDDFPQFSIIATIPGKSEEAVIVGAHQDSINLDEPETGRSPGADDNGSGSMTTLEAFRVVLQSEEVSGGNAANTIEFHWYAGEEAGLLGSQAIFSKYASDGKKVKGMMNQDMTGYVQGMVDNGVDESFGLITDNIDDSLNTFVKTVIEEYCSIPAVESSCGYTCSDHASADRNGYPAAFVMEAPMEYTSDVIHSDKDDLDTVNYDHMLEHAKMVVGFVTELGLSPSK